MRILHVHDTHVLVNLKHLLLSRLRFSKKKNNINIKLYYNYLKIVINVIILYILINVGYSCTYRQFEI